MEVLGGAPFMDGEWESICRILSFDQDSDLSNSVSHNIYQDPQLQLPIDDDSHVNGSLFGLLMGSADPFICSTQSSCSDVSNGSLVNVNGPYCHQFVQPYCNDDDQVSSLLSSNSPSIGFLARNGSFMDESIAPMINGSTSNWMDDDDANGDHSTKRKHDPLEIQAESPVSKKRTRVMNNRKMQPRKTKKEQKEQKSSCESSDNESNGSQEVINEEAKETPNLAVKKKASRGGATDPQSLYARKRRERINERLRTLQNLVPNGTKVDISTMLEEAVNYVKFLQLQIKLLSSDEMWMYAPLAYNGFDGDLYNISPHFLKP